MSDDTTQDEPGRSGPYRSRKSLSDAASAARNGRNRNSSGEPKPTKKLNVDPYYFSRLKARYIASRETIDLADLGKELAEYMGCDETRAVNYVRAIASGEDWKGRRIDYWDNLQARALARQAENTIEAFEAEMRLAGRQMVDRANEALVYLVPTYRAHRAPNKISRYLSTSDPQGETSEQKFQKATKEEYAVAIQSDLAALAPEMGRDAAANGD
jgi:hypothetical protein